MTTEDALRGEVEALAQRFPDVDRAELEQRVRSTHEHLKHDATPDAPLAEMTGGQVAEELTDRGENVRQEPPD